MNKKPTILAVAALGSLALIGTGFAGWVIVANPEKTANGNITAYSVADRRLIVSEAKWGGNEEASGSIIFGKPANQNNQSAWFFGEGTEMKEEKLEDYFVVGVHAGDLNDNTIATVTGEITVATDKDGAWNKALTKNYVATPTITFNGTSNGTSDVDLSGDASGNLPLTGTTEVAAKFTVKFSWGTYFQDGNKIKNPYDFFNTKNAADTVPESGGVTWGEEAKNVMGAIASLKDLTFTATVTFTHASSAAA